MQDIIGKFLLGRKQGAWEAGEPSDWVAGLTPVKRGGEGGLSRKASYQRADLSGQRMRML